MKSDDLHGIYPALPTPLTTEGRPDFQALEALVHRSLQAGVAGLVPMGGTGEFTALSNEDRVAVVRHVVEVSKGAVPVLPGVVSPGYKDSVELGQAYKAAGADALMLVTPFYVTPTQAGVKDYFRAYAKQAELPLVYYDIPARTGLITAIDTLAELAEDGTIIGVKVCHTDLYYFNRLATKVAGGLSLLSGDDMLYVSHRMHGAVGGVLASAPMLPRFYVELDAMITAGDFAGAIAKHRELLPVFAALFNETNPGPLKAMLSEMGFGRPDVALPLMPVSDATKALIAQALALVAEKGWG